MGEEFGDFDFRPLPDVDSFDIERKRIDFFQPSQLSSVDRKIVGIISMNHPCEFGQSSR